MQGIALSLGTCLRSRNSQDMSQYSRLGSKEERWIPKIRTINDDDYPIKRVVSCLSSQSIHLHGKSCWECGPTGFDDDPVWMDIFAKGIQSISELTDQVATDAAIEKLLHPSNRRRGGQLRIDSNVTEFVLQEGELLRTFRGQRCFAR